MSGGHTLAAFDAELAALRGAIDRMGELVERQVGLALDSLAGPDADIAGEVLKGDAEIDRLESEVEAMTVRLLALRQPMAKDLREIVAALKIASNLERMGDFAGSVAKRAVTLATLPVAPPVASLVRMGRMVQAMIGDMRRAFTEQDVELAISVRDRDGEVDAAYTALFREFLTYMMETPAQITGCTHLLFAAKSIERIGDHATNVAENISFLVKGRLPSDERRKEDLSSYAVAPPRDDA
ncbi:PhoU family transcriptional regulator [Azospirillum sp. TSH100]|uniref:phosphate signaling complex protein PhoU n=1 Tax=Azospirillum sp. TSH100 TaxID=652764 RepID=UPI000D605D6B|nr:phosphate signaling complex protein PhoU [Azospirillum sp. TSH100]PWC82381.1 PhoU family transcriptional regulator [Azospirillum sp. TSH100]QCG87998.1 phosphate signaling complex protein PhoU [Azospirillum sp. TSH100]